ncbi:hypothetical protein HDV57DRAFT_486912 [Trichoderma longibrachiatum]|uniref:CBM1 domain-containing protein n=1 Tax=Trichoderma longibrachiatum ATCC 18648 TaxID=983965 RepID=A0A2T4BVR9_TRILO|nr:hypothetical protein M440DRAFT_1404415 [Trichoderma longibrachiatum ATCC 18648]
MQISKLLAFSALATTASAGPMAFLLCQAICAMNTGLYGAGSYRMCQAGCWLPPLPEPPRRPVFAVCGSGVRADDSCTLLTEDMDTSNADRRGAGRPLARLELFHNGLQ